MSHRYSLGQTVLPTVYVRELNAVYEVIRPLPEDVTGAPQYRLRNTATGVELLAREAEGHDSICRSQPVRARAHPLVPR
jgi:hypothetical protein